LKLNEIDLRSPTELLQVCGERASNPFLPCSRIALKYSHYKSTSTHCIAKKCLKINLILSLTCVTSVSMLWQFHNGSREDAQQCCRIIKAFSHTKYILDYLWQASGNESHCK
jgi:hypothetical protein